MDARSLKGGVLESAYVFGVLAIFGIGLMILAIPNRKVPQLALAFAFSILMMGLMLNEIGMYIDQATGR
jgi:hypothetical protein